MVDTRGHHGMPAPDTFTREFTAGEAIGIPVKLCPHGRQEPFSWKSFAARQERETAASLPVKGDRPENPLPLPVERGLPIGPLIFARAVDDDPGLLDAPDILRTSRWKCAEQR